MCAISSPLPSAAASIAMNTCERLVSCSGSAVTWWVARPAASDAADRVEHDRETCALPESDGQWAVRRFDGGGIACEPAARVKPSRHGQRHAAGAIGGHRAVTRTATAPCRARDARPGAAARITSGLLPIRGWSSPHGGRLGSVLVQQIPITTGVGRLPAVRPAAHPVVCVREGDAADAMHPRTRDGTVHRFPRVEHADAAAAVPALQAASRRHASRARVHVDDALRIIAIRRGNRFRPCEGTPSRVEPAMICPARCARAASRPTSRARASGCQRAGGRRRA
jgi:hypothetical protein